MRWVSIPGIRRTILSTAAVGDSRAGIRGSDCSRHPKGETVLKRALILSFVVLPLVFAAPTLAVPPTTEVVTIEDFTSVDTELCGFPITFTESGTFMVT